MKLGYISIIIQHNKIAEFYTVANFKHDYIVFAKDCGCDVSKSMKTLLNADKTTARASNQALLGQDFFFSLQIVSIVYIVVTSIFIPRCLHSFFRQKQEVVLIERDKFLIQFLLKDLKIDKIGKELNCFVYSLQYVKKFYNFKFTIK